MDCRPPGSSVHGILQAKILEWVAIPFFSEFPDPGMESRSSALQACSFPSEPSGQLEHMTYICFMGSKRLLWMENRHRACGKVQPGWGRIKISNLKK